MFIVRSISPDWPIGHMWIQPVVCRFLNACGKAIRTSRLIRLRDTLMGIWSDCGWFTERARDGALFLHYLTRFVCIAPTFPGLQMNRKLMRWLRRCWVGA